ncbi:flagellar basal-body rod protein FlgF [Aestuariivirga sp.]|uniref:flagellar basal-body rod protein FlgF n=1 Tax=Aestuariivirga sp. TaxID=2650926 RepID=UPI0039E49124
METSIYSALSGAVALDRRLSTIANNVANAASPGFRAESVNFQDIVSRVPQLPSHFSSAGEAHVSDESGALTRTGNPLDVAVQGTGFMAIETAGGTAYTRDGRLQMLSTGDLVTLTSHPVLDAGGAPLIADPAGGPVAIARDGMLTQNGKQIGAIGLFDVDLSSGYGRYENSGFVAKRPGTPILSFTADGFAQGFVEEANVNPIREMTSLITVSRLFESLNQAMEQQRASESSAIQTLGAKA